MISGLAGAVATLSTPWEGITGTALELGRSSLRDACLLLGKDEAMVAERANAGPVGDAGESETMSSIEDMP
jgi:hypothetical protein